MRAVRHVAQKHSVTKHFEVIVGYLKYLMDKLTPRLDPVSKCCQPQTVTVNAAIMDICMTNRCLLILGTFFFMLESKYSLRKMFAKKLERLMAEVTVIYW